MNNDFSTNSLIIDRYQLLSVLGKGAMGITYKALDRQTKQQVAIKIISLKQIEHWQKFESIETEVQVLQKLRHSNIPLYLDYFTIENDDHDLSFCLVQQLVIGKPLNVWRQEQGSVTEKQIKKIIKQFLNILIYIHGQTPPIIHRDIKPQNIIIDREERIYLVDFGAVQISHYNTIAKGKAIVGTYGYMPIEQSFGKVTPASDLYSLGATILYLLTNCSPAKLDNDHLEIDVANCLKDINISRGFIQWLTKMLEMDLNDRFQNATEALNFLNKIYLININYFFN